MTSVDTRDGLKAFAVGRRTLLMIDPRVIRIEPGFNARDFSTPDNLAHVEWLKSSILTIGMKEPLTVRLKDGKVMLVGGESRLRAVMQAIDEGHDEIKAVPCQPEERATSEADRVAELVTRNSGKKLTPIEQAAVVRRLLGFGWEAAEVAEKLTVTSSYVSHLMSLLVMPAEAQEMVRQGEVSAKTAIDTVRTQGEANGVAVMREAVVEAKAAGKKKATGGRIRQVAARQPSLKPHGMTLNTVKTEKVLAFLRWLLAHPNDGADIKAKADLLLGEVLAR